MPLMLLLFSRIHKLLNDHSHSEQCQCLQREVGKTGHRRAKLEMLEGTEKNVNRFSVGNFQGFHLNTNTSYKGILSQACFFCYFEINLERLLTMESQQLFKFHRSLFLMHIHMPGIITSNAHDTSFYKHIILDSLSFKSCMFNKMCYEEKFTF